MPKRRGRKSAAQTPSPPKERIFGSKKNPKGSASSEKTASKITLSEDIINGLEKKLKDFKEKHPSNTNITLADLKAVFRRGAGAYSKSHRPYITGGVPNTRNAWAYARVNKFLKKASGQKVKEAYVQDDDLLKMAKGGLIAPNGKQSNLTPEQYKLVRTPQFKAWFGDWENDPKNASKVVDENGEPKVMYHGTLNEFYEFTEQENDGYLIDRNIYFFTDDLKVAKAFAYAKKRGLAKEKKIIIINAFVNSRKPFDPTSSKTDYDILYKITKYQNLLDWMPNNWELLEEKKVVKKVKQLGYDSIITTENDSNVFGKLPPLYQGKSLKNLGVFNSNQIKLADGSNTTFDGENPDIRYEDGGKVDKLISDGIVEIKMFDTTNEHSKIYGFDAQNPLYLQSIIVSKEYRGKGIGSKVFEYIVDYANKNKHDLIFGHITQKAEPSIDAIKSMLNKAGFNTIEGNNDFYKKIDMTYAKGGEIDPKVLRERWAKKKDALENLANNIKRLKTNLYKDLKGNDEKEKLTALVILTMNDTGERVGNEESAENGHLGITGLKKKNITIHGSKVKFKYTGKSGVEHEKEINNNSLATYIKEAIKKSPSEYVFETSDGFRIKNDRVNRYLNQFDVSAKDLRGYSANTWIINKLKSIKDKEVLADSKTRKKKFNEILKDVAEKVGHGRATLKKHYLLPSLEREFINHGKIVDLSNIKRTYEDGGEVDKVDISAKNQFAKDLQQDKDYQEAKENAIYDERGRTYGVPNVLSNDPYVIKQKYKHIKLDDSDINDDDMEFAKGGKTNDVVIKKLKDGQDLIQVEFTIPKKAIAEISRVPLYEALDYVHHRKDLRKKYGYEEKENYVEGEKLNLDDKVWYLQNIEVKPRYRGQGYASQILKVVFQWCHQNDVKYLYLYAMPYDVWDESLDEKKLKAFYEKYGFKEIASDTMVRKFAKGGKLLQKYAFADKRMNDLAKVAIQIQSTKDYEPANELEYKLYKLITDWTDDTTDKNANQIYRRKELFDKLREQYPKIFKAPKNQIVYRGIGSINKELLELFLTDFNFDDVVKIKGWGFEDYYFIKRPISYVEKRSVQSWTTDFNVACNFGEEGAIFVKKTNDEFYMNPKVLNEFSMSSENEVLHLGKRINDAYILLSDTALSELESKISDLYNKKAKNIKTVTNLFSKGGKTEDEVNTGVGVINNLDSDPLNEDVDVPNDGEGIFKDGGKIDNINKQDMQDYKVGGVVSKKAEKMIIPTYFNEDIELEDSSSVMDINPILKMFHIPFKVTKYLGGGASGQAFATSRGTVLKITNNGVEAYSSYIIMKNQADFKSESKIYNIFIVMGAEDESRFFIEKEMGEVFSKSVKSDFLREMYDEFLNTGYDKKTPIDKALDNIIAIYTKWNPNKKVSAEDKKYGKQLIELGRNIQKEMDKYEINLQDFHEGNVGLFKNKFLCFDCAYGGSHSITLKNTDTRTLRDKHKATSVSSSSESNNRSDSSNSEYSSEYSSNTTEEDSSYNDPETSFAKGGELSKDEKKEIYAKWKKLINMSRSELKAFYDSDEGKVAGLTANEAKEAGIDSGRESARWILKMKATKVADWSPTMWKWAKKQISFVSRMSGNKGKLLDEKGEKTRKYLSLLIWGNDPMKKSMGGDVEEPCHVCEMNETRYNQFPMLQDMVDGKRFLLKEDVFRGGNEGVKHHGVRYMIVECMGEGGMLGTLNLKVIQSSLTPSLTPSTIITRPIRNIVSKGREMGNSFGEAIIGNYKKGGELNPDKKEVKDYFAHASGKAGGLLVGNRHSEGGIKAINKSTGQPLEMEGGEVVITRDAVSDPTPVEFEGEKMTKREVLSKINESGGGVAFADGGDVASKTQE